MLVPLFNRFFLLCFGVLSASVYGSTAESGSGEQVELSDAQVPRYLEASDVIRWDRARNLKREGLSDIESGEWMRSRRESSLGMKVDTTRVRQRGEERIRDGKAKVAEAESQLAALRALAAENFQRLMIVESRDYTLDVEGMSWAVFIDSTVPRLLNDLWSEGYSRLFFSGAYQFNDSLEYSSLEELEDELRAALLAADDRYSLVVSDGFRPLLVDKDERLVLRLPEGKSAPPGFKAAIILLQMIPLDKNGQWLVSVRGIDLDSGRIMANATAVLPEYIPAEENTGDVQASATSVRVKISDDAEFIQRVERSKRDFLFSVLHRDRVNIERVHRDLLLLKSLLFSHLNGVVSDTDFLLAIHQAEDSSRPSGRLLQGENAVWLLNPVAGGGMQLHARNLAANTDLKVGTVAIEIKRPEVGED